jgi:hypothetical protein
MSNLERFGMGDYDTDEPIRREDGGFVTYTDAVAAIAAERKATVERIRAAALSTNAWGPNLHELLVILDAAIANLDTEPPGDV